MILMFIYLKKNTCEHETNNCLKVVIASIDENRYTETKTKKEERNKEKKNN